MITWLKKLFGIKPPVSRPTHNLALWVIKDSVTLVNLDFDCWEYEILGVNNDNLFVKFDVRMLGSVVNHVVNCYEPNTVAAVLGTYKTVRPQKVNGSSCLNNVILIPLESIKRGY